MRILCLLLLSLFNPCLTATSNNDFTVNYENEYTFQKYINAQEVNQDVFNVIQDQSDMIKQKRMNGERVCNLLEFSGIGAYGALTTGLASKLNSQGLMNKTYDAISGSSGASINALIGSKVNDNNKALFLMRNIWASFKDNFIYMNDTNADFEKDWGFLDNAPLKQTIKNIDKITGNIYYKDAIVDYVSLLNNSGISVNLRNNPNEVSDIIASSMNMPIFFKKMMYKNEYVIDGSIDGFTDVQDLLSIIDCNYYVIDLFTYNFVYNNHNINSFEEYFRGISNTALNMLVELYHFNENDCKGEEIGIINLFNTEAPRQHQSKNFINYNNSREFLIEGINSNYLFNTVKIC